MKFSIKRTKLIGGGHVVDANIHPNTRANVKPKTIFSFETEREAWDFLEDIKSVIAKHCPHTTIETIDEMPREKIKSKADFFISDYGVGVGNNLF